MSAPIIPGTLIDAIEIDPIDLDLPADLSGSRRRDLALIFEHERSNCLKPVAGTGFVLAITLGAAFWLAVLLAL